MCATCEPLFERTSPLFALAVMQSIWFERLNSAWSDLPSSEYGFAAAAAARRSTFAGGKAASSGTSAQSEALRHDPRPMAVEG